MENSIQKSQAYFDYKSKYLLKKKLIDSIECEVCKESRDTDTYRIRHSVKTLDYLDGVENIPEEFSLENFTKRFNSLHNMNLLYDEEKK